jgi:preprotein translocase subunit YajC
LTTIDAVLWLAAETPGTEEGGGAAPSGGLMSPMMIILIVGMIAVMWFMSRRNKKQQQQQADARDAMGPGDRVMTTGGMIGVITEVEGDVVTIMSPAGDRSVWVRRAIRSQVSDEEWEAMIQPYPPDEDEDAEADGPQGEDAEPQDAADESEEEGAEDEDR